MLSRAFTPLTKYNTYSLNLTSPIIIKVKVLKNTHSLPLTTQVPPDQLDAKIGASIYESQDFS